MGRMLVVAAVGVVCVVAGCGESSPGAEERAAPAVTVSAAGEGPAVITTSRASVAPTGQEPLATVEGSQNTSRLQLIDVRRVGNAVQARMRLLRGDEFFHPEVLSADGESADLSGARMVDPVNLREHLPLQDAAGNCMCTHLESNPYRLAETVDLSVQFPAPPPDVNEVSISVPTFASFDGIRLG